jgi:hypothetical protein
LIDHAASTSEELSVRVAKIKKLRVIKAKVGTKCE